jgi:hypothetical protein
MSHTLTAPGRQVSSRLWTLALAVAIVIAVAVTIVLFAVAVGGGDDVDQPQAPAVQQDGGVAADDCQPGRVPTAC